MAERPSGKKLTANELVLRKLNETFNTSGQETGHCNVWVMLAAVVPFGKSSTLPSWPLPSTEERPSHHARVVVRTSVDDGANPYVDGSDFIRFPALDLKLISRIASRQSNTLFLSLVLYFSV